MNPTTPEPRRKQPREQTLPEEIANAVTHGIGLLLSVACLAVGVVFASIYSTPAIITSVAIHGATLCILYLSSTLYHSLPPGKAKRVWNIFDHASIYLLIAGTYTPITLALAYQQPGWGWSLFGIIWGLALVGIVFQALPRPAGLPLDRPRRRLLLAGRDLLRLEAPALHPCRLAPLRAGRQPTALPRNPLPRRPRLHRLAAHQQEVPAARRPRRAEVPRPNAACAAWRACAATRDPACWRRSESAA